VQAARWRPTGGRHAARTEGQRACPGDHGRSAIGAQAVGAGRDPDVDVETDADSDTDAAGERAVRWLQHPATVDRIAAIRYESRTGRWLSAVEVDRIGYLANARAVLDHLAADLPS
jgi:hypothetical protein